MNVLPLSVPYTWSAVQLAIECLVPGSKAIIGGGALRDLVHGKPHKDLDVFVQCRRTTPQGYGFDKVVSALSPVLGKPTKQLTHTEYLDWSYEVVGFANWTILGEDVQVIGIDYRPLTMSAVLERFDIGLCQIAYDGRDVVCTDAFQKDVKDQTMTVLRCDTEAELFRTRARYERLRDRNYPEYAYVPWEGPPTNDLDPFA